MTRMVLPSGRLLLATPMRPSKLSQSRAPEIDGEFHGNNKTGWRYFEDKDIKAYQLRKQIESLPLEEQHKRNNVEAAMFQYSFHTRNGKTRYRGLLKHRMHAYSRCMWMNLRRMVIFQISTFQRSIFALFGPIREAFGSFMAISRKIFTCEADCYVSLRMTTLVRLDSKYVPF